MSEEAMPSDPTTYVEAARAALLDASEESYESEDERRLLDLYTLLVMVKGEDVTLEDIHDAWAVWRSRTQADHDSIVPFSGLSAEVQSYDEPYAEAVRAAAPRYRSAVTGRYVNEEYAQEHPRTTIEEN